MTGYPMWLMGSTPVRKDGDTPHWNWMAVTVRTGWGTPCPDWKEVNPSPPPPPHQETEQQSEHLLRGGRYASCVHAAGLSWLFLLMKYILFHA